MSARRTRRSRFGERYNGLLRPLQKVALRAATPNVSSTQGEASSQGVPFEDLPDFIELEDWELAETIQQAERLVQSISSDFQGSLSGKRSSRRTRVDQAHNTGGPNSMVESLTDSRADGTVKNGSEQGIPWLVLAMGLGVFVCGAALIVISLVSSRPQLWQLGLPMVLGGQVAILAVVVSQLDSVWSSNRATFVALHAMDDQLRQMHEQWTQLQDLQEEPAFYRHLAQGASPEILLSDLKDQIDVLSQHLAQQKRAA